MNKANAIQLNARFFNLFAKNISLFFLIILFSTLGTSVGTVVAQTKISNAQDDPNKALEFVRTLSNDAITVLDDMSLTQNERDQKFEDILEQGFDLDYIGKLTLGRHWRTASGEQKEKFSSLFPDYVLSIYSNRLRERGDETFDVTNTVPAGKKDLYVRSQIIRTDGPPVAADWRVRFNNGEFRIVDLKVEGISMVLTQRDEFSARINEVGMDGLLSEIEGKITINNYATSETVEAALPIN